MSRQLAVSSAFSLLIMASFVLLGPHTMRAPLDSGSGPGLFGVEASALLPR